MLLSWFSRKNKYKQLAFPYSTDSLKAAMHASIYLFMMIINVEAITDFCLHALVTVPENRGRVAPSEGEAERRK
jgi:hypothetical protein